MKKLMITPVALIFLATHLTAVAKRDKQYVAKQITNLKIDGDLGD